MGLRCEGSGIVKKTGRPALPPGKKRETKRWLRWTAAEWDEVKRMAEEMHMTIADFQRVKILRPGPVERDAE